MPAGSPIVNASGLVIARLFLFDHGGAAQLGEVALGLRFETRVEQLVPDGTLLRRIGGVLTTILVVTHDLGVADQCQRILKLRDGKIVEDRRK